MPKSLKEVLEELLDEYNKCRGWVTHSYQLNPEAKLIAQAKSEIEKLFLEMLPKEKTHPHLNHSTRDEDNDGGWCDTCQTTFEISTQYLAGFNSAIQEMRAKLEKD